MKRNSLMEECRTFVTPEIKENIDFNIDIVNRIFDILEEKSICQRDFSKLMNKNEAEISRWMQGTNTIKKIERALDAPILKVVKKRPFSVMKPVESVFYLYVYRSRKTYTREGSFIVSKCDTTLFSPCIG